MDSIIILVGDPIFPLDHQEFLKPCLQRFSGHKSLRGTKLKVKHMQ